jgi:hypothetical protein
MKSTVSDMTWVVAQVQECVESRIGYNKNVSTAATITTGWSTPGNKLFTSECGNTIASVSPLNVNLGAINKHLNQNDAREHNLVLAQASRISKVVVSTQ